MQRRPVKATPGADLQEEARLVRALDAGDEAAHGNPHGREDRREEEKDHRPVVPGPFPPRPEGVVGRGEDDDEDTGQDSGQHLAGGRRDPEP